MADKLDLQTAKDISEIKTGIEFIKHAIEKISTETKKNTEDIIVLQTEKKIADRKPIIQGGVAGSIVAGIAAVIHKLFN